MKIRLVFFFQQNDISVVEYLNNIYNLCCRNIQTTNLLEDETINSG